MSNETFKLKILTPLKAQDEVEVNKICVVTDNGEVTILPNHVEYLANVEISLLKITIEDKVLTYAVSGGAIHFDAKNNKAILTLNSIYSPEEIDIIKLKEEEKALENQLKGAKSVEEHKLAERNLKRIINQLSLKK